jgi:hypothetical protein
MYGANEANDANKEVQETTAEKGEDADEKRRGDNDGREGKKLRVNTESF